MGVALVCYLGQLAGHSTSVSACGQYRGASFCVIFGPQGRLRAQLCHLPSMRPQSSYFCSPSLSFRPYKVRVKMVPTSNRL